MLNTERLSEWEKMALISFMMTELSNEQRTRLAHTLPDAYNKLIGADVMTVNARRADPLYRVEQQKTDRVEQKAEILATPTPAPIQMKGNGQ